MEALKKEDPLTGQELHDYASRTGAAIFAGPASRFECLYSLGMCARCISFATRRMDACLDRLIAYLAQTEEAGITYDGENPDAMVYAAWADSDWSIDTSTTGGAHTVGGVIFHGRSRRQRSVALSSTEAEIMAGSEVGAETMYHRGVAADVGYDMGPPTILWIDNSGAVALSQKQETSSRSRHIERRYLKLREWVAAGHIDVRYKNTEDNRADLFTKPLMPEPFCRHRDALSGASDPEPQPTGDTTACAVGGIGPLGHWMRALYGDGGLPAHVVARETYLREVFMALPHACVSEGGVGPGGSGLESVQSSGP